jgi:hypothetical protein
MLAEDEHQLRRNLDAYMNGVLTRFMADLQERGHQIGRDSLRDRISKLAEGWEKEGISWEPGDHCVQCTIIRRLREILGEKTP